VICSLSLQPLYIIRSQLQLVGISAREEFRLALEALEGRRRSVAGPGNTLGRVYDARFRGDVIPLYHLPWAARPKPELTSVDDDAAGEGEGRRCCLFYRLEDEA